MNIRSLVFVLSLVVPTSCRRQVQPRRPTTHEAWPALVRGDAAAIPRAGAVVDAQVEPLMRDGESIRTVMMNRLETINDCYSDLLTEHHQGTPPQGTIELGFDIRPDGTVGPVSLRQIDPRLENAAFIGCAILAFRRKQFPAESVGLTTVTYPFTFRTQQN